MQKQNGTCFKKIDLKRSEILSTFKVKLSYQNLTKLAKVILSKD